MITRTAVITESDQENNEDNRDHKNCSNHEKFGDHDCDKCANHEKCCLA